MNAQDLADAVTAVRSELDARYPVRVDTTRWSWDDGVRVEGGVLVAAQAQAYVAGLGERLAVEVPSPAVLADLQSPWTLHTWVLVLGRTTIDLHRSAEGDDLQTQWIPPVVIRWFARGSGRALVQLPDGTVGWMTSNRLMSAVPSGDPWAEVRRATAGQVADADDSLDELAERARGRLGRPYLWGGNTAAAADCSGFVQSLLHQSGLLLPKNTKDQRHTGERVAAGAIEPGDLVFVRGNSSGLGHVGLALPSADGTQVIHSCLTRKQIVEEPLDAFLGRYRFTAARRVLRWSR